MMAIPVIVICCAATAVGITLIGLAVTGALLQRSRRRADARLDVIHSRVLQFAVALSDQTRAEGADARVRLIRAAHAAMTDRQADERRR